MYVRVTFPILRGLSSCPELRRTKRHSYRRPDPRVSSKPVKKLWRGMCLPASSPVEVPRFDDACRTILSGRTYRLLNPKLGSTPLERLGSQAIS
jgi:hypothetical protein